MHKLNLTAHTFKIEERRRKVASLLAQSMTECEIAQELNVNSTLSDNRAIELEYSQTVEDKIYRTLEVWTELGEDVYFVVFDAEASKYNHYLPIIQKMIDSFKIEEPKITKTKDFSSYENSAYGITSVAHFECLGVAVPQGAPSATILTA